MGDLIDFGNGNVALDQQRQRLLSDADSAQRNLWLRRGQVKSLGLTTEQALTVSLLVAAEVKYLRALEKLDAMGYGGAA